MEINGRKIDFDRERESLEAIHVMRPRMQFNFAFPDGRDLLRRGLNYYGCPEWLPEYDRVAAWLENPQGQGLLMLGDCGRGKTVIARGILPILVKARYSRLLYSYNAQELNTRIDAILKQRLVVIDDIGTEEIRNNFGNKRNAFAELIDSAESEGKFLVVTTNLSYEELEAKYTKRTTDRLRGMCRIVVFRGGSLRGEQDKTEPKQEEKKA